MFISTLLYEESHTISYHTSFREFLVQSQTRTVRGKVTAAEDGLPIPGVTVMVKGSVNGTISDIEGNYQIEIKTAKRFWYFVL